MASYNETVLLQQPDLLQKCLTISLGIVDSGSDPIEYYDKNYNSLKKFFRNNTNTDFKISKEDQNLKEFNTIYYIDTVGNLLAYTKYNENLQYNNADVVIKTDFKITSEEKVSNLSELLLQNDNKIGNERYSYTSAEIIKNYEIKDKERITFLGTYNTSVESTLRDGSCIFNRDSIIRSGLLERLHFSSGFFMKDAIQEGFDKYDIATYKEGIALYAWRKKDEFIEVRIVSLSKQNLFGEPILLTKKNLGYIKIPYKNLNVNKVLYFAGKYAVLSKIDNQLILFNLETENVEDIGFSKFFIDLYDKTSKIVSLNEGNLSNIFPELNDLDPLSNIFAKRGNWAITKSGNIKYYGPYFNYIDNDISDNIIIVNDRTLLICKENIWKLVRGENDEHVIDLNNIYQSPLQYFRRNSFYSGKIKTIISAYKGIIYYMTDNGEIKYL